MMSFPITINYIIIVETFLGISRNWNFTDQRSWKRLLTAAIWIISTVTAEFLLGRFKKFYDKEYSERVIRINAFLTAANAILTMIWGSYTSRQFEKLIFHLSEAHWYLKPHSENVRNNLNFCTAIAIMLILLLVLNSLGSFILLIVRMKTSILDVPFQFYWINIVYMACLIRGGTDYLLFLSILKVMSMQLKTTALTVREIGKKFGNYTFDQAEIQGEYAESVDKICTAYIHSWNSCRLANAIFCVPMSASFGLLVLYHIIITYGLVTQSMSMGSTLYQTTVYAVLLLANLLALTTVSVAGQQVHNNADSITRALAYLLTVTNAGAYYPVTRRAMRVVSARPIRLVLFGSTKIGTALLPASLAIFTTYLIIALQFNNVV